MMRCCIAERMRTKIHLLSGNPNPSCHETYLSMAQFWRSKIEAKSPVLGGFYCTDNNVNSMSIKLLTLKICLELQEQSCRPLFPTQTLFLNTQQFSISTKNKHSILSLLTNILITQTLF